ncbi:MAG: energy-coupling factor ABC transporter ATP-binding protein [Pseudomonadota bacterium]
MIIAADLFYSYPGRAEALSDIRFELEAGRILGLIGANGSGKSTLLSLLAGLFSPTKGRLQVGAFSAPGREKEIRSLTGLVVQDADLQILGATVGEDLTLGWSSTAAKPPFIRETAARFGLAELWDRPVQDLSWGQKRRLCLAATLVRRPKVLLLDEPFSGLDYPGILEMRKILRENREAGLTQVIAAHDLEPLADLADQWLVLDRGRVGLSGNGRQVFARLTEFSVRPPCSWQAGLGIRSWDWGPRES